MKITTKVHRPLCLLGALLSLVLTGLAQERFSTITGTVKDATGAVIPAVKVTIENTETKRAYSFETGSDGVYNGQNVEPGRYDIQFEKTGFGTQKVQATDLLVGRTLRLDATLQVGNTAESVTVTETAGLIDLSTTKVANNITAVEFDRLPKGRSFQSLALTSTSVNGRGANGADIEGGFQVNGASGSENNFIIDGVSTNSIINGVSRQSALFDILAEVQVKTSGLDAEYGGAMGGGHQRDHEIGRK